MEVSTEVKSIGSGDMLLQKDTFEQAYRAAKLFASSKLVPQHLQGKEADCFIALHIARRMQEDPLMVMQNLYIVSGKPGWAAQYMIARANRSGIFKGRITWDNKGSGETLEVTAKATLAETGEVVSASVNMKMAKAEGWTKNAKYQSMPEHMFKYRSATMLIRLYAPEVMLGYQTIEEIETLPEMKDVTPPKEGGIIANINAAIEQGKEEIVPPANPALVESLEKLEAKKKELTEEEMDAIDMAEASAQQEDDNRFNFVKGAKA